MRVLRDQQVVGQRAHPEIAVERHAGPRAFMPGGEGGRVH